jgi:hypothetical protein
MISSFHLVDLSPLPIFTSLTAFTLALSVVAWTPNYFAYGSLLLFLFWWWKDVIRESTWLESLMSSLESLLLLAAAMVTLFHNRVGDIA